MCEAALVVAAYVHEDGKHARPPRRGAGGVLVVVHLVELARLVAQDLHRHRDMGGGPEWWVSVVLSGGCRRVGEGPRCGRIRVRVGR